MTTMEAMPLPMLEFDSEFMPLIESLESMFTDDNASATTTSAAAARDGSAEPSDAQSDVSKVYAAVDRTKDLKRKAKELFDQAREDLRAISRKHDAQKAASSRSGTNPAAHEAKMVEAQQERMALLRQNTDLEQTMYRLQAELERLQQDLQDEQEDAVTVDEIDSAVLRIKLYRSLGFIPASTSDNGKLDKMIVRSRASKEAKAVELDKRNNDFFWSNFLWDALEV